MAECVLTKAVVSVPRDTRETTARYVRLIQLESLYCAPSRNLLRGAPSPTAVIKIRFEQHQFIRSSFYFTPSYRHKTRFRSPTHLIPRNVARRKYQGVYFEAGDFRGIWSYF